MLAGFPVVEFTELANPHFWVDACAFAVFACSILYTIAVNRIAVLTLQSKEASFTVRTRAVGLCCSPAVTSVRRRAAVCVLALIPDAKCRVVTACAHPLCVDNSKPFTRLHVCILALRADPDRWVIAACTDAFMCNFGSYVIARL